MQRFSVHFSWEFFFSVFNPFDLVIHSTPAPWLDSSASSWWWHVCAPSPEHVEKFSESARNLCDLKNRSGREKKVVDEWKKMLSLQKATQQRRFWRRPNQNSYKYLCYVLSATAAEHEHAGREERKLVSWFEWNTKKHVATRLLSRRRRCFIMAIGRNSTGEASRRRLPRETK